MIIDKIIFSAKTRYPKEQVVRAKITILIKYSKYS